MREQTLLSILIPSIPSRFAMLQRLVEKLEAQIGSLPVEVLIFSDNKCRSIGEKRDALNQLGRGRFQTQLDDDDEILPEYTSELIAAVRSHPNVDVIVFNQRVFLNNERPFIVRFGMEYENEPVKRDCNGPVDIVRLPFHVCAWRRELAQQYHYSKKNYGEDWDFAKQLVHVAKTQYRIDKVLHEYHFSDAVTEAK